LDNTNSKSVFSSSQRRMLEFNQLLIYWLTLKSTFCHWLIQMVTNIRTQL